MRYSKLVDYVKISPNRTLPRKGEVRYITIHCMGSEHTVEELGEIFFNPLRNASSNYGIDKMGMVGLYAEEEARSWCTGGLDEKGMPIKVNGISGADNDHMAITIEVACKKEKPHIVSNEAIEKTIELCVDICMRYNKKRLIWIPSKESAMRYVPMEDELQLTVHRWFSNKECPGEFLFNHLSSVANRVTSILESV